jgi:hypothetical protein
VLKDERPGLIAVTLGTGLIEAGQAETAGGFHDIRAVRIVALNAVHFPFNHGMMLRHRKLRMRLQVALKTGSGVLAGIQNKSSASATDFDVFATGTVTGFATTLADARIRHELHAGVRAGGEDANVVGVALKTGLVAHVISAGDGRTHHYGARRR